MKERNSLRPISWNQKFGSKRGMTFLEIVVVMLIVGILSAVFIPRMDITLSNKAVVEGAAFMVASDIRYAQEFSMATGVNKTIVFMAGSTSYSFQPTHTLDPSGQLPEGVRIGNNFTVTFNSFGEPIAGGDGSLTIIGRGETRTIGVLLYTGKVNIS